MSTTAIEIVTAALPEPVTKRGIKEAQWRTLCNSLYPGANPKSVLMVWDYCASRRLDPLKKPCHIVPMEVKTGNTYEWRDVVMPGIYELRTTAQRTGEYLGHAKPEYGPVAECAGVKAPEWCEFTVYRWNAIAEMRAEYPVRVLFSEVVATKRDGNANSRWSKAPTQMLTKCAEAAALREAFPDELGGEHTAEEMDGQRAIDAPAVQAKTLPPKPAAFDEWRAKLETAAQRGEEALGLEWQDMPEDCRLYLNAAEPSAWDGLKAVAASVESGQ